MGGRKERGWGGRTAGVRRGAEGTRFGGLVEDEGQRKKEVISSHLQLQARLLESRGDDSMHS